MKYKLNDSILLDIDGTVAEDIPNEEDWRFPDAKVLDGAVEKVNGYYDSGKTVTFFTARTYKHRDVTLEWLKKHGFRFHGLITDKPRGDYTLIDDKGEHIKFTSWSKL